MHRRAVLTGMAASMGAPLVSRAAVPDLRSGIVIVVLEGQDGSSEKRYASATGFLISKEGYLVTSHHVLRSLGPDIVPETLSWKVFFGRYETVGYPATPIAELPHVDLLVLAAKVQSVNFTPLRLHSQQEEVREAETRIYCAGYPGDGDFKVQTGFVTSLGGTVNPASVAWAVDMPFKAGQSGSPVYLENGHVVGIVKSSDDASPSVGYVVPSRLVPSYFWDTFNAPPSPDKLSSADRVQISAEVPASPRMRTKVLNVVNKPCARFETHIVKVEASPGWDIDLTSITTEKMFSAGEVSVSIENPEPQGFEVLLALKSMGECAVIPGAAGVKADAPGRFNGAVRFRELPRVGTMTKVPLVRAPLVGGLNLPIDSSTKSGLDVKVTSTDGGIKEFTAPVAAGKNIRGQFSLEANAIIKAAAATF